MIIHLYALCWNEENMLPHFFRHYEKWVDQFFIYDNGSNDASLRILKAHPKVSLNHFTVKGDSFVLAALDFYNHIWKQGRGLADWVILCNIDEFIYHPRLKFYLLKSIKNKITIIPTKGYQMISTDFPIRNKLLTQSVRYGNLDINHSKIACFNPQEIEEINFNAGRHHCNPLGKVIYPKKIKVKLLHYKYLSLSYVIKRYAELGQRLKTIDREKSFGFHYFSNHHDLEAEFNMNLSTAKPVISFFDSISSLF